MKLKSTLLFLLSICITSFGQDVNSESTLNAIVKKEMGEAISDVLEKNKEDTQFIMSFHQAQSEWQKSVLMDLDLLYPIETEENNDANDYCRSIYLHYQIKGRKNFILQLVNLKGSNDGCLGNMPNPKRKIITKTKLDTILSQDTIIFDKSFSVSDFLDLLGSKNGIIQIRNLPKGDLEHFISIDSDTLARDLARIKNGKYHMLIRYLKATDGSQAIIKKTIRVKDAVAIKENETLPRKRI